MKRRELMLLMLGATLAPRGLRAEGDASDRLAQRRLTRLVRTVCGRVPPGTERRRLCRGTKRGDRLRWANVEYDRLAALAADLVRRKVDVIAALSLPAALAAKSATSTIPIVFVTGDDPVAIGLVASLARPGGNVTGVSFLGVELQPKRLELLCDLFPQAS